MRSDHGQRGERTEAPLDFMGTALLVTRQGVPKALGFAGTGLHGG